MVIIGILTAIAYAQDVAMLQFKESWVQRTINQESNEHNSAQQTEFANHPDYVLYFNHLV